MNRYECSGCGSRFCDGRCFDECPLDYPEDERPVEKIVERELRRTLELQRARAA